MGTGRQPPVIVGRDDVREAVFNEGLEPGRTYPVLVKTLSGNVASWPATANITTRNPLLHLHPIIRFLIGVLHRNDCIQLIHSPTSRLNITRSVQHFFFFFVAYI